ncbi:MAG: hypothetical protein AB7S26_22085 [Sandaracinaceae bacterium]
MSHLLSPCPTCERHVRISSADDACPFCGAASPRREPRPAAPRGVSRPAILAIGAAIGASVAMGCSGTSPGSDGGGEADAGTDAGDVALPYGAPPLRAEWV